MSYSKEGVVRSFIITYPNSEDKTVFYVSNLNGDLIQKTTIGSDGVGVSETINITNTSSRSETCTDTVNISCSSGEHSYQFGNAGNCDFWSYSGGTPPVYFSNSYECGGGSSGSGFSGGGGTTVGTAPTGSNSPPAGISTEDCVSNLDCEDCNLSGDLNDDCYVFPYEICLNDAGVRSSVFSQLSEVNQKAIETFINENGCNSDAKNFAVEAIEAFIDLDNFKELIEDPNFDPINNPWLKQLRNLIQKINILNSYNLTFTNIILNNLNSALDHESVKILTTTALIYNPSADTDSESTKLFNLENDSRKAVGNLLYDFANGKGPDKRDFYNGDFWDDYFEGDKIDNIKADFETKLLANNLTFDDFNNQSNKIDSGLVFSPDHTDVVDSIQQHLNANLVQFFVGGASIEYWPSNTLNHIDVIVKNGTSRNSLLLHLGAEYDRDETGNIPLSTIDQNFYITIQVR